MGNYERGSIDVHVYGIPRADVMLCKLQKDRQLLDQLNQSTKEHHQCNQPAGSFITFMYKGNSIDQSDKSTPDDMKMKSKDHILAISPWFNNCLDINLDVEDIDRLHVKVLVFSMEKKIHHIMTRLNKDFTAKYLRQKFEEALFFGGAKDKRAFSVVHNGFILEDGDTFSEVGVCEFDTIALIDLRNDAQLEKLIILNSYNSESGISGGVRVLHNLDPRNLEGHVNTKSAAACKSLLRCVKSELAKELEDFFLKTRNRDLSIYFDEQMAIRMKGSTHYVHATDLLSDICETLLMMKIKCKIEKSLWKAIVTKVLSFVQESDLSKTSCGQDYEPFKNCAVSVIENFPLYSDLTGDSDCSAAFLQETVLYIGPKRDGRLRPDLPIIKLRAFTYQTTIQDLINSYKVYTNLTNLPTNFLTFNNKVAGPTDLVKQVLGGMFEKNYLGFLEPERLDSVVEYIEGKAEKIIQKKKKKKRVKPVNSDENPIEDKDQAAIQQPQSQEIKVSPSEKISSPQVKLEKRLNLGEETESDPISNTLKLVLEKKETLKNENKFNLQQVIEVKSKEMKTLLVKISGIEDENCLKDKRINSIDAEISDLETRVAKLKKEKKVIDEEKDAATNDLKKWNVKKFKLEKYIELEMIKAKERELELETEIVEIREELNALLQCDANELSEQPIDQDPRQKLLDFLTISISEKKKDLECPVCLETASVPIYSCQENHLICSSCRPMVKLCPECRMEYGEKVLRRHRYAEKTVRELERLREERRKIME